MVIENDINLALLDPEAVIVTGGLGRNLELMGPALEETLRRTSPLGVRVLPSTLDNLAVIRGATAPAACLHLSLLRQLPQHEPSNSPSKLAVLGEHALVALKHPAPLLMLEV